MTQKTKKALNITVNVIVGIIVVFVLALTINIIASGNKGYTNLFGNAYVAVKTDSMEGDKPDSFFQGDLLKVQILSDEQKKELKEGDIITFYEVVSGIRIINSHRIVEVGENSRGLYFRTQGDNPDYGIDGAFRYADDVIGKVVSRTPGIGNVTLWLNSSTGFFVCVVLPSLLIVVYCVYNLVKVILERNKQDAADKEAKLKEELLAQLRAEGKLTDETPAPAQEETPPAVPAEESPKQEEASVSDDKPAEAAQTAEPEEAAPAQEEKPAAPKKTTAKKKQPIILSAEPEEAAPAQEEKPATPKKK